jgi:Papain-like cysteine protease AvrRpt2
MQGPECRRRGEWIRYCKRLVRIVTGNPFLYTLRTWCRHWIGVANLLSRRRFLSALPAAAMFRAGGAHAAEQCLKDDNGTGETCSAGVVIGNVQTARQRCENWCWAACIETIFSLRGYKVNQEDVVKKVFRTEVCSRATVPQIIEGIGGVWSNKAGSSFRASAYALPDTLLSQGTKPAKPSDLKFLYNTGDREVIAELNQGNPLIVGALGHATVLTAIKYRRFMGQPLWLTEITVRDPWPDNPNRRLLTADEFAGSFFVAKVVVQAA